MPTALLLMAHGSRREEANADLEFVAGELHEDYSIIECGYLELATPTIVEAAERCVRHGAERVLMLPFFLSAGIHVTEDLQNVRKELAERFGDVEFRLCEPIGRHPLIIEIVRERAKEAKW